mgnify:CR=1 FL=1
MYAVTGPTYQSKYPLRDNGSSREAGLLGRGKRLVHPYLIGAANLIDLLPLVILTNERRATGAATDKGGLPGYHKICIMQIGQHERIDVMGIDAVLREHKDLNPDLGNGRAPQITDRRVHHLIGDEWSRCSHWSEALVDVSGNGGFQGRIRTEQLHERLSNGRNDILQSHRLPLDNKVRR